MVRRVVKPRKKMAVGALVGIGSSLDGMQHKAYGNIQDNYDQETGRSNKPGLVKAGHAYMNFTHPWRLAKKENRVSPEKYLSNLDAQHRAEIEAKNYAQFSQFDTADQGIAKTSGSLMPFGGEVPGQETVELEQGEPFMTPDGQISGISDNAPSHAQGGVPITLPSGTKVLGKKPATDEKTFKELGSKLEKRQSKYQKILDENPSRIEEITATRMLEKLSREFGELFELQGEDTEQPGMQQGGDPQMMEQQQMMQQQQMMEQQGMQQGGSEEDMMMQQQMMAQQGGEQFADGGEVEETSSKSTYTDPTSVVEGTPLKPALGRQGGYYDWQDGDRDGDENVVTMRGLSAPYYRNIGATSFKQQLVRKNVFDSTTYNDLSVDDINKGIENYYNTKDTAAPYKAVTNEKGDTTFYKDYGRFKGKNFDPSGSKEVISTFNKPRVTYAEGGGIGASGWASIGQTAMQSYGREDQYNQFNKPVNQTLGSEFDRYNTRSAENQRYEDPRSFAMSQQYANGGYIRKGDEGLGVGTALTTKKGPNNIDWDDKVYTAPPPEIPYPVDKYGNILDGSSEEKDGKFKKSLTGLGESLGDVDWGNVATTGASLAPSIYNMYKGRQKPNQLRNNSFANPYESEVRATLRDRKYNVEPQLEAARNAQATYARQLREGAPTQAQYLGGLQAGAIGSQRAMAAAYATKNNTENQYLAGQAKMDQALGSATSARLQYIEDINARERDSQDAYTGTGLTQLAQAAQTNKLMSNQKNRDLQRLGLLPDLVGEDFYFDSETSGWKWKKDDKAISKAAMKRFVNNKNKKGISNGKI